jgi:hypothetical protein
MRLVKAIAVILFLSAAYSPAHAQSKLKMLPDLVSTGNANWERILMIAGKAKNKVEILPRDSAKASVALIRSQLSTNTLLGSVIYNCGGIIVDEGWVRILGSGCGRLQRSVPDWNAGKIEAMRNEEAFFLLIADDVLGGLFAIKASSVEELESIGTVFYYGPNSLTWQSTGLSYSSFLIYCFNGDLHDFYDDFRWKGWQEDVKNIDCNSVISCYPMLWTREGLQLKANRKLLAIQSQWNMYQGKPAGGGGQKSAAQLRTGNKKSASLESMWTEKTSPR